MEYYQGKEEEILLIEYEYNLLFWVDFFYIFVNFDYNVWFFDYGVVLIKIKFGFFFVFFIFGGVSFIIYFFDISLRQVKMV